MEKNDLVSVKDAVHKLQLALLEGINNENQLFAAGSLLSKSDYQDVVTERTIAMLCGYPLCSNSLTSERRWKGRYRISLKEHKVYDVQETYMYCSSGCLISSQTFLAGLQEERSSNLDSLKLNKVLKHFDSFSMDSAVNMGFNGEFGLSELKITEKKNAEAGEVSIDEWIGPSNAIDGYVPRRDQNLKTRSSKPKREPRHADDKLDVAGFLSSDMCFTSVIIAQDEYNISKTTLPVNPGKTKEIEPEEKVHQGNHVQKPDVPVADVKKTRGRRPVTIKNAKLDTKSYISEDTNGSSQNDAFGSSDEPHLAQERASGAAVLRSSLRTSHSKKSPWTVSWADQKNADYSQTICNFSGMKDNQVGVTSISVKDVGREALRFECSESCSGTMLQANEGVASQESVASDAVSEQKVNISPHSISGVKSAENCDGIFTEAILKWPPKQGFSNADFFDSDDSWYETPPDGFNLSLSPFCSIFNALFAWISSSSIAYIYGKEESSHEEYTNINGRKYPHKVVTRDGRSSEIKQTLAGYLARALPGVVAELRLPVPISTIEQGMGRLLDTMSFVDPLPSLRMKQWQVVALLLVTALSVKRIPALTSYLTGTREAVGKVVEGAQLRPEEYEILKELIIPLVVGEHKGKV